MNFGSLSQPQQHQKENKIFGNTAHTRDLSLTSGALQRTFDFLDSIIINHFKTKIFGPYVTEGSLFYGNRCSIV